MMNRIKILAILLGLCIANFSQAQIKEGLRVAVKNNKVYLYHNLNIKEGYGFNVYRNGEQLNQTPVTASLYPEELMAALGDDYELLAQRLGAESPTNLYFKLKSNLPMQRLATFLYPQLAVGLGRLYLDDINTNGQQVNYKVILVNNLGDETQEFYETNVTLNPRSIIAPNNLSASNKGDKVTLSWRYPKSDKEVDDQVIQFNIYRRLSNGLEKINEDIILRNGARDAFKITFQDNQPGKVATYFVHAIDIAGDYAASQPLTYQIRDNVPPGVIGGLNSLVRNNTIALSWNIGIDTDMAGYHVYRSERMREGYQRITKKALDPLNTYFVDSTAREGHNFSYKISAIDLSGNESELSLAVQGRINDNIAPDKLSDVTADFSDNTVSLSWAALNDQSSYRSYIVLKKLLNGQSIAYSRLNQNDLRDNQWMDKGTSEEGFIEGVSYQYCLLSMDSASNFSDSVFAVVKIPDLTPPMSPEVLQATNQEGLYVTLRWNASKSADTEYYQLYRTNIAGERKELLKLFRNIRQYKDTSALKGQSYRYAVAAIDSLGNEGEETISKLVKVKDNDPPRSVRNVIVDLGTNQIKWEPVVAFDLAGYNIYQADIATGEFKRVNDEIRTETYFTTESLESGKWYRIRSVDNSGNESKPSSPTQAK